MFTNTTNEQQFKAYMGKAIYKYEIMLCIYDLQAILLSRVE